MMVSTNKIGCVPVIFREIHLNLAPPFDTPVVFCGYVTFQSKSLSLSVSTSKTWLQFPAVTPSKNWTWNPPKN